MLKVHGRSVLHISAEKGSTEIYELLSDPTYQIDTTLKDKVISSGHLIYSYNTAMV